ncbi:phosphatidylserine decarboxylase [Geosporobacter subterraneus DSM 17957]|uniref:Phosphatidylserine decarboxylase proenzyme n=1 Tax=Geosporobacter subterraneus DSM 17957 TaxID=1121919 RepID=A0A1M6D4X5_9FIRM|nr:phosphatidylserine decarboxylase [Geosporobacter subterraneus]SHI68327.1 phosphatidylserine decarboxylase [Geosporobacter subterraneus DSM 17957]
MEIYYIDRKTGEKKKEIVAGEKFLKWIYDTRSGKSLLEAIVKRKIFSTLYGKLQDVPYSSKKIPDFVKDLEIDLGEAQREKVDEYRNFNDFFARELKPSARPICRENSCLIAPADGRALAYEDIDIRQVIQVKGSYYSLEDVFNDKEWAEEYQGGTCIIVRLCPADYHRFHFPDSGIPQAARRIKGEYYSVNPISLHKVERVYCVNKREITKFGSDHFGEIAFVEVGATCVGTIIQTYKSGEAVDKGQEKGYFKFGGSTVILFLKKGQVKIDEDIIQNTKAGFETRVLMGEAIGRK